MMTAELNTYKIMTRSAEKAGIDTRNGDTYFLEEKPIAGEKLLKMTRTIISEVESHLREKIEEELNDSQYYDNEEQDQSLQSQYEDQEDSQEESSITESSEERVVTSNHDNNEYREVVIKESQFEEIKKVIEENNKNFKKSMELMIEKMVEISKKISSNTETKDASEQFRNRIEKGISKDKQSSHRNEILNILKERLKKCKPSRGYGSSGRIVEELVKSKTGEMSNTELATKTRLSRNTVRDSMLYIDKNLQGVDYKVKKNGNKKYSVLEIKL